MESHAVPCYQPIRKEFIDGGALRVLSLQGFELCALTLQELDNEIPNLRTVRFAAPPRFNHLAWPLVNDRQFLRIHDFMSKTRLCEIAFHDITQNLPWLDMVSASGQVLRQLTIHTAPQYWLWARVDRSQATQQPPSFDYSPSARYLRIQEHPGFVYNELIQLNSICPNIET